MPYCKDCKLYDLDAVKDKAGRILSKRVAQCLWESTEVWPESIINFIERRKKGGWMPPNVRHRCQRFIKRED